MRLCKSHRAWSNNHMGLMPYHPIQRRRTKWAGKSCAVPDCDRKVVAKGLCASHWSWRATMTGEMLGHVLTPVPVHPLMSVIERIELRIVKDPITGCWVYGGKKNKSGYGVIKHRGRTALRASTHVRAHGRAHPRGHDLRPPVLPNVVRVTPSTWRS